MLDAVRREHRRLRILCVDEAFSGLIPSALRKDVTPREDAVAWAVAVPAPVG